MTIEVQGRQIVIPVAAQSSMYSVANRHLGRVAPQAAQVTTPTDTQDLRMRDFVKQAWPTLVPAYPLVSEWYVDCICEHLEACHDGRLQRLLVNMPPRAAKSTTISVMWNAWAWTKWPWLRWLFNTYADNLSMRDALAARRLIESGWYQARWGHVYQLTDDQNRKERYDTNRMGYRVSSSVKGQNTGEGGDITVTDDPHNVLHGESDAERQTVLTWHSEVMPTRVTSFETHVDVVVMQRVHESDLSGYILTEERGYHHLCLPGEYVAKKTYYPESDEVDPHKPQPHTDCPIYSDPRTEDGESLDKGRFTPEVLAQLAKDLKPYGYSGQVQQRPIPRVGAEFADSMWRPLPPGFDRPNEYGISQRQALLKVVYFDLNYSEKEMHDHAAAVVVGMDRDFNAYVLHVWRVLQPHSTLAVDAADMLKSLRPSTRPELIYVEEAAFKKAATQNWARQLRGLLRAMAIPTPIDTVAVAKDKVTRAKLTADTGKVGQLYADRDAPWWPDFVAEHLAFPKSDEDDQVDAEAGAIQAAMEVIAQQPEERSDAYRMGVGAEQMDDVDRWLAENFDSLDRTVGNGRHR